MFDSTPRGFITKLFASQIENNPGTRNAAYDAWAEAKKRFTEHVSKLRKKSTSIEKIARRREESGMTTVYIVDQLITDDRTTKRVSLFHGRVFHGQLTYESEESDSWTWPPFSTNNVRELPHITRSGSFVPPVFGQAGRELIVSAEVKERLSSVSNVQVLPVVFEHLVDLTMPDLGDFTWMDQAEQEGNVEDRLASILRTMPNVQELHSQIGEYFLVLAAHATDVLSRYDDVKEFEIQWSPYASGTTRPIRLSDRMLQDFPIVWDNAICLREDAFAALAPYLDLDYFAVSIIDLADDVMNGAHELIKRRFDSFSE